MIINREDREQMIEIYVDKSIKAFRSCLLLCNSSEPDYEGATNRAYYSMFLTEKALLLTKGIFGDSHKHTHMSISKEFVREGELPQDTYQRVKVVEESRRIADYSGTNYVTKEELYESVFEANSLLNHAKKILLEAVPNVAKCWYEEEKMQFEVERALKSLQCDTSDISSEVVVPLQPPAQRARENRKNDRGR